MFRHVVCVWSWQTKKADPLIGGKGEIIARPGTCSNLNIGTSIEKHERRERSFPAARPAGPAARLPKNVGRLISKYVDREKSNVFFMLTS